MNKFIDELYSEYTGDKLSYFEMLGDFQYPNHFSTKTE